MAAYPWSQFIVLWLLSVLGAAAIIPYAFELNSEKISQASLPRPVLILLSILQTSVLMAVAAGAGLWVAGRVGLGAPVLAAALAGEPAWQLLQPMLLPALLGGLAIGIALISLEIWVFRPRVPAALHGADRRIPLWKRLLACLYGGLNEEVLLRLFLMSLLAWLIGLVWQAPGGRPAVGAFWAANLLAALLFGLGHLPATAAITRLTPMVITRGLVLNGLAGVLFGFLYFEYGLEAAILAHFGLDIVIHVLAPFFNRTGETGGEPALQAEA